MGNRLDPDRFHICTHYLHAYARDERHVRELAECGIDCVIGINDPLKETDWEILDLLHKYGIGCVRGGVLPQLGDGSKLPEDEIKVLDEYKRIADEFIDHPAIWGHFIVDEPPVWLFPSYGRMTALLDRLFPGQFAHEYLLPSHATEYLGVDTYEEYIRRFTEQWGIDHICFDFYCFSCPGKIGMYYDNLRIVADACRDTGRRMWVAMQVNSKIPEMWISANQLRFQANAAMAFGAELISWECWCAGWWYNQVLDDKGNNTEQYEKLKTVNHELRAVADDYMRYRRVDTHLIGFPEGDPIPERCRIASKDELNTGVFFRVRSENGRALLVGQMIARDGSGRQALWIVNVNDPNGEEEEPAHVTMSVRHRRVRVRGAAQLLTDEESFGFDLPTCCAALVELDG